MEILSDIRFFARKALLGYINYPQLLFKTIKYCISIINMDLFPPQMQLLKAPMFKHIGSRADIQIESNMLTLLTMQVMMMPVRVVLGSWNSHLLRQDWI